MQLVIHPAEGARISKMVWRGIPIIDEPSGMSYHESYAGAWLFPFAGRLDRGAYEFGDRLYQFETFDEPHALHGIVAHVPFEVMSSGGESVTLCYCHDRETQGFPFALQIIIKYTLTADGLNIDVRVKNTGDASFPFSLGWHPYFHTGDMSSSGLLFDYSGRAVYDDDLLLEKMKSEIGSELPLGNVHYDDCFKRSGDRIEFKTPHYQAIIDAPSADYLQVYTPPLDASFIAIEPMTAPGNALNNKMSLLELDAGDTRDFRWGLRLFAAGE